MKHHSKTSIRFLTLLGALILVAPTHASQTAETNVVADWNAFATELFVAAPQAPIDTRVYAIQHAAIHDALNTISRRYRFYTGACGASVAHPSRASVAAAVAAASRDVLVAQLPNQQDLIDERYALALAAIPEGPAKRDGVALGQACAATNLARRADDGLSTVGPPLPCPPGAECPVYVPTDRPGDYQFTPPFDAPPLGPLAALPGYGNLLPFAIHVSRHQLPGPDRLRSLAYAADFNYLKVIGASDSVLRTAEQSEIAQFWYESSGTGWNRIANTIVRGAGLNPWKTARIFALVNFALADGYIAHFDVKYRYRFWRPITAIRQGAADGNP